MRTRPTLTMAPPTPNMLGRVFYLSVLLLLTSSMVAVESIDKYHVQVRLYVEPSAISLWTAFTGKTSREDFKKEIMSYFVEVQKAYESLVQYNKVAITLEIESYNLLDTNVLTTYKSLQNNDYGLFMFRNRIVDGYRENPYDLAMLITGSALKAKLGFAYINKVCDMDAVSVVQYGSSENFVLVIAHEIGHVLGAEHDDGDYEDSSCYKKAGYIMGAIARRTSFKRFQFSYCSSNWFKDRLKETTDQRYKRRNCLKDGHGVMTGERLGKLITPDENCERGQLKGGFVPRESIYGTSPWLCQRMNCADKTGNPRFTAYTMQGLNCGKNKVCNRGLCEESPEGSPFVLDSCPLGDQPKIGPDYSKTCADINPSECSEHKAECCYSCNKTNPILTMTADDVCVELAGKEFVMLRSSTAYGDQLCSQLTCAKSTDGKKFSKKYFTSPDGMACGKSKRCDKGKCVSTKHGNPDIPDRCPFGDQDLSRLGYKGSCEKYSKDKCGRWGSTCCQSCQGK